MKSLPCEWQGFFVYIMVCRDVLYTSPKACLNQEFIYLIIRLK